MVELIYPFKQVIELLHHFDFIAILLYLFIWYIFENIIHTRYYRHSVERFVDVERVHWLHNASNRRVDIADSLLFGNMTLIFQLMTSISAALVGACLVFLIQMNTISAWIVSNGFDKEEYSARYLSIKAILLIIILGVAFFRFGWCSRGVAYTASFVLSFPKYDEHKKYDQKVRIGAVKRASRTFIEATKQFNLGIRTLYFALGLSTSFINGYALLISGLLIFIYLIHNQYFSRSVR